MKLRFVKMHGCENDYVYLDAVSEPAIEGLVSGAGWADLVRRMSDRHRGIGGDGVIVVCPPRAKGAHVRMRMFNADGSESEMCGNGVRCVAKLAHDRVGVRAEAIRVETGRGVLDITYETLGGELASATVNMGEPTLELDQIPVDRKHVRAAGKANPWAWTINGFKGGGWTFVSMGNPHAVFVSSYSEEGTLREGVDPLKPVKSFGPYIETHRAFPRRTNVHFFGTVRRDRAEVFTWERGAGVTRACGTGACAALVAGVLNGFLDREATIRLLGGELRVRWDEGTGHVFMTGEAVEVFEGEWGR